MNERSYNIIEVSSMNIKDQVINRMENTLKIASDATRLKILFCLLDESDVHAPSDCGCGNPGCHCGDESRPFIEKCVNDIALEVGCSQSLISHQLKVLKDGNFVKSRKEKTRIYYSLKDAHVREIIKITHEHVTEDDYE